MYTFLLYAHSWNRWFVLLAFVSFVVFAIKGLVKSERIPRPELIFQKAFVGLLDLQFLLGLGVLGISPLIAGGNIHPWVYQHVGGMFVAICVAHAANSIGKKKPTPQAQRKVYLLGNLLAVFLILGSIPWPFMKFARPLFRF